MTSETSDQIIAECAVKFNDNQNDCNQFLKAVAASFFDPDLFSGPCMNADAIIAELQSSNDWTSLRKSHRNAIRDAKAGKFVIAGMTSTELGSNHGHLAVVVGDSGQNSGTTLVPICYAGSLNAIARVQRKRVSATFPASLARDGKIEYFSRTADTEPSVNSTSRLVDFVRGLRVETELKKIKASTTSKTKKAQKKK
ncbi:MAG: hypothetical protein COC04_00555 [Gammaproteobacteria bacterium]|nr:MAG: hypothetical protein COC04_00555 [Gammaproteobacteria bacterium]